MSATVTSYPQKTVDSYLGTTQQFKMFNINGVKDYAISFSEGTLSGGTTPTWNISASNPIITHVTVLANNNPIIDTDIIPLQEYMENYTGQSPDGLNFVIPLSDLDPRFNGQYIADTELPTFDYTDVELELTFASLSTLTNGSPTSSSGTTMDYAEDIIPRAQVSSNLFSVRRFMYSTGLSNVSGFNDLTQYLPQVGTYKALQMFASTSTSDPYRNGSNSAITNVELLLNQTSRPLSTKFSLLRNQNISTFRRSPSTGYATILFSPSTSGLSTANINELKNLDLRVYNNESATTQLISLATIYI